MMGGGEGAQFGHLISLEISSRPELVQTLGHKSRIAQLLNDSETKDIQVMKNKKYFSTFGAG